MSTVSVSLGWKGRLLLMVCGVLLSCGLIEAALRFRHSAQVRRNHEKWASSGVRAKKFWAIPDADLQFRQNPEFADFNAHGLRNPPIGEKDGRYRVLLLGDSVAVWGNSVEDTFVAYARRALALHSRAHNVELINAGQMAYTNFQELVYLKKFGLDFAPDLVGVQFCLNDLHKTYYQVAFDGTSPVRGQDWLKRQAQRSHLFRWAGSHLSPAALQNYWLASRGFAFDYRPDVSPAWQDLPWTEIESQLHEMSEIGRERNFRVFVMAIPLAIQYEQSYLARNREYVLKPQRQLKAICEKLQLPYLDVYPELDPSMFLDDGMHLSAAGRKKTGELLAQFLLTHDLLSSQDELSRKP